MASPSSLDGMVAIVTGSSRSIGAAIAKELARKGARVVINYLKNLDAANELVRTINSNRAGAAIAVQADVSTLSGGTKLLSECLKAFGKVDILVLNAGVMGCRTVEAVDEEFFDSVFNIHVKGPLFLTRAVASHLSAGTILQSNKRGGFFSLLIVGGRIIFLSSAATQKSTVLPDALIQAASKAAIEQCARVLAKNLGAVGVTVNTVSPGPIDTDLFREGKTDHKIHFIANLHPQKRLGSPEDIASLVTFLSSPEAAWINGQNIHVNGVNVYSNHGG